MLAGTTILRGLRVKAPLIRLWPPLSLFQNRKRKALDHSLDKLISTLYLAKLRRDV